MLESRHFEGNFPMKAISTAYSEVQSEADEDARDQTQPPSVMKPQNWRQGVRLCTYAVATVMALNIVLSIIAGGVASANSGDFESATLYEGSCSLTKGTAVGLHLLINILSTILLAASSYCMQGLAAPSRNDVDRAHAKRIWIYIGTNGLRNLRHLSLRRILLWASLFMTSLPLHLLYNSAVFSTLSVNEYAIMVASSENENIGQSVMSLNHTGCWYENTGESLEDFATAYSRGQYQHMTLDQCIDSYGQQFTPGRGLLVLLVDYNNTQPTDRVFYMGSESPTYWYGGKSDWMGDSVDESFQYNWVATWPWTATTFNITVPENGAMVDLTQVNYYDTEMADLSTLWKLLDNATLEGVTLRQDLDNSSMWLNATWASQVQFHQTERVCTTDWTGTSSLMGVPLEWYILNGCLEFYGHEACQLRFVPAICLVVILCNALKVICMFFASRTDRGEVLLTVGDAIASFLDRPDPHTAGQCLLSKDNVSQWSRPGWFTRRMPGRYPPQPQYAIPRVVPGRKRWWQAVSARDWCTSFIVYIGTAVAAAVLVQYGLKIPKRYDATPSLQQMGFGTPNWSTMLTPAGNLQNSILSMILVSNTPQLLLSVAYFFYNRNLTSMVLAAEYDTYATSHKPLRVSWPKGAQKSTYFLTLPYRYSVPLLVASALLHWLVSESVFYILAIGRHILPHPRRYLIRETGNVIYSTLSWSPMAIICAVCVGFGIFSAAVVLGCKQMKSQIPLAGNCSASISSACHPPEGEKDASQKHLRWGEVLVADGEYGHCSFTSRHAEEPSSERLYS